MFPLFMRRRYILFLLATVPVGATLGSPENAVDFARDIQPLLQEHCVQCHGPDKQRGGYRLDVREIALTGGDHHAPNILPHQSAESPLIRFVSGTDEDLNMPPKGPALPPERIDLLRRWIDQGAAWPDSASAKVDDPLEWWSLQPLAEVTPPADGHPVDAFLRQKLAENGLSFSPEADARTLVRRVYYDLTGLPPTPEEQDAFVREAAADKDGAWARLVDRLLASPRYGERWARHWLDVVHYADTHGYDKDKPRPHAWPYRDYVIRAFNEDKPYARFVEEQIAGDVLYPGTRDGIEALGFIAAGPWDLIGHEELSEDKIDGKIARHLDRDDMVGTVTGAFLSVTAQCAQCHNHKFDPVPAEDYYALQAVFAAVDRADKPYDLDPAMAAQRATLTERRRALREADRMLRRELQERGGAELTALDQRIKEATRAASAPPPQHGWHSEIAAQPDTVEWVQVDLGAPRALEQIVLIAAWDDYNDIGRGFGFPRRFRIEAADDAAFAAAVSLVTSHENDDFPNPGITPVRFPAAGLTARYLRVTATMLAPRANDYIFALAELQALDAAGKNLAAQAAVASRTSIEAGSLWSRVNLTDDIYPTEAGRLETLASWQAQRDALIHRVTGAAEREKQRDVAAQLAAVEKELDALPQPSLVYAGAVHHGGGAFRGTGADGGRPRPIHLLARGQITSPGREVPPGALSAITALPARFVLAPDHSEGERRAALARWITDPRHPLTWRSIVNRVWQYHFGAALADTPDDFGRMGGVPSHPALLDWLARDFRDHGGSLKQLTRLIVTSAAYRQSSSAEHEAARALDAGNRLLWRQNRRKLEAEAVRDSVLMAAGTLDLTMGGPGWQDFVVERPEHSPHYRYDLADPDDRRTWRRAVYRFIVRSQMQPFLTALDCADPSIRVEKRNESVSAAQALALQNNGFMVSQARHFAERLEKEAGPEVEAQVRLAWRLAFGREAPEAERARLEAFATEHGLPNFCRVLFNLNEFAFVD